MVEYFIFTTGTVRRKLNFLTTIGTVGHSRLLAGISIVIYCACCCKKIQSFFSQSTN